MNPEVVLRWELAEAEEAGVTVPADSPDVLGFCVVEVGDVVFVCLLMS